VIITELPPAIPPEAGLTPVMVGATGEYVKTSLVLVLYALFPVAVVTVTK
jgi:hypothetical protein